MTNQQLVRGMAHFARTGPAGKTCGGCAFLGYEKRGGKTSRGCKKFFQLTGRHGPKIPRHTQACKYFEQQEADMPSVKDLYPKTGFFSAKNWDEPGDLHLQIDYVEYDVPIGNNKLGNAVHFKNDKRTLVLGYTVAHTIAKLLGDDPDKWPDKWITLYLDPDVEYKGERTGGVRVRETAPAGNGNGTAVVVTPPPKQPPAKPDFNDDLPPF